MDANLPMLLSFPPHPPPQIPLTDQKYNDGMQQVLNALKTINTRSFLQSTSSGEHILDVVDPALNTVSYAVALAANLKGSSSLSKETLFEKMATFLQTFDSKQIRYVGNEYTLIVNNVAGIARQSHQPELAIIPISDAILRIDPTGSTLTSAHIELARLALESQVPSLALSVLDQPILYFPGKSDQSKESYLCSSSRKPNSFITTDSGLTEKLRYQDVLEYFILTGSVYIACQNWEMALDALECAINYPTKDHSVSKIMVEAYKKWILVHVLLKGKAGNLPSMITGSAPKLLHTLAKPYETIANLFEQGSASRLKAEADVGAPIWSADDNTGLICLLLSAYQKFQICNMANIYRTIPVSDVTRLTLSAETEKHLPDDRATERLIEELISQGTLKASLVQCQGTSTILSFFDSSAPLLSEQNVQLQLTGSMVRLKAMVEDIKATDHRLTYDKEYLNWAQRQKKQKKNNNMDPDLDESNWGDIVMDGEEDLMSNL